MRSCRVVTLLALLVLGGCQRPDGELIDRLVIGEVMMNGELKENLRELCLPGGRLSGSANAHQAEQFVAEKLREYGLGNVHLEQFTMGGWQVNETAVTVLTDPPFALEDALALCNTQSTPPGGLTAELIDVGAGSAEEFESVGEALAGKFALVSGGKGNRRGKMLLAREHDVAGVIYIGRAGRDPVIGGCHLEPCSDPGIAIRYDEGEKLAELLAAGESARLNVEVQADIWDAKPNNVVADITGTGPLANEMVILCAHLDSWHLGEGAIDNGNGAAAILETARALNAIDWQPRRTVRFVWFMGEEQNLYGSKAYVAAHEHELDDLVAVINVDMPGSPRKFATFGHPEIVDFLESVQGQLRGYEIAEEVGNHRGSGGSDHAPFVAAGVCAVSLWGDIGEGGKTYHTPNDKYEVVDRRKTIQSAAALGVLVRQLADCPERPTQRLSPSER